MPFLPSTASGRSSGVTVSVTNTSVTCNIQQSTHTAATGNVSQPAVIIKVYGI